MAPFFNRIRTAWRTSSAATRLIAVNIIVFAIIRAGDIIFRSVSADPTLWLGLWAMPADLHTLALRPWTPVVYMFAHYEVLHLLFNMLWLYGFARIFIMLSDGRRLAVLYVCCGLAGAACFTAVSYIAGTYNAATTSLLGSSAAVMGIVTGAAALYPDMPLRLFPSIEIKLKWIALSALVLFVLTSSPDNPGGQYAHIGGAATGLIFGLKMRRGSDITQPLLSLYSRIKSLFAGGNKPSRPSFTRFSTQKQKKQKATTAQSAAGTWNTFTTADQAELDSILEKVKKSGYTGLSAEEKRRLFEVSKRIK